MLQTVLMGQYVLLHPRANPKLQALLKGTPMQSIFILLADPGMTCPSPSNVSSILRRCIYLFRFFLSATLLIFNPQFYVGSTSSFVLDREHSRYRKISASATT